MPDPITLGTLEAETAGALPEIADELRAWVHDDEEIALYGSPNWHEAIDMALVAPVLRPLLGKPQWSADDELLLVRILSFVERMMASTDAAVVDLADTGVIEGVCDAPRILDARRFMGPLSRQFLDDIRAFWFGPSSTSP